MKSRRGTKQNHFPWRNAMLAISLRSTAQYDLGHVAVLACAGDPGAAVAVTALQGQLLDPAALVRISTFEDLIARAKQEPSLSAWADAFRRRYLSLEPITAHLR